MKNDESREAIAKTSQFLARKYEYFIKQEVDHGHTYTAAHAIKLTASVLLGAMGSSRFSRKDFMLEIDKILVENSVEGSYFWAER